MFVLLVVKDTIPVQPKAFGLSPATTILDALNKKYANKLIPDKGLALSVFDILTAEDGKVTWGNGLMYYKVSFRLMLFAPFYSEVIVGRIMEWTRTYVRGVSYLFMRVLQRHLHTLRFFTHELYVPYYADFTSDIVNKKYFWYHAESPGYDENGEPIEPRLTPSELMDTVVAERLYLDRGEPIRFRVESIEWQDIRPEPAVTEDGHAVGANGVNGVNGDGGEGKEGKTPYDKAGFRVIASIVDSGLGLVSWWGDQEAGEDDMQE